MKSDVGINSKNANDKIALLDQAVKSSKANLKKQFFFKECVYAGDKTIIYKGN